MKPPSSIPFHQRLTCRPKEACAALGISMTSLYGLIGQGKIETRKLPGRGERAKTILVLVPSILRLLDIKPEKGRRGRPRKVA